MTSIDKALGDTLALLNVARQTYGFDPLTELPRARPGDSHQCVYARALKDIGVTSVGGSGSMSFTSERVAATVAGIFGTVAHGNQVEAPVQFASVIGAFDGHKLPQYED